MPLSDGKSLQIWSTTLGLSQPGMRSPAQTAANTQVLTWVKPVLAAVEQLIKTRTEHTIMHPIAQVQNLHQIDIQCQETMKLTSVFVFYSVLPNTPNALVLVKATCAELNSVTRILSSVEVSYLDIIVENWRFY